jgi:hypothetical protein
MKTEKIVILQSNKNLAYSIVSPSECGLWPVSVSDAAATWEGLPCSVDYYLATAPAGSAERRHA